MNLSTSYQTQSSADESISGDFKENDDISRISVKYNRPVLSLGLIIFISTAGVILLNGYKHSLSESDNPELASKHLKLDWTLNKKGYDPLTYFTTSKSEYLKYEFLDGIDAIVEPNAKMHLYVEDFSARSQHYYSFEICSSTDDCQVGFVKSSGIGLDYKSIEFSCEPFETFDVTISKYSDDDELENEYTGSAICMYVRREMRSLTSDDLEATMDAMYTLWSTTDEDGQKLYGSDFHNITYLLQMHHFNAAWMDADHFHEVKVFALACLIGPFFVFICAWLFIAPGNFYNEKRLVPLLLGQWIYGTACEDVKYI